MNQESHIVKTSFKDGNLNLLIKYDVDFNKNYLFEFYVLED
jgi:hypothetical protein